MRATCPAHLILIDFITRTLLGEPYRWLSCSLCNFLQSPVILSLLGQNILLSTPTGHVMYHQFNNQQLYALPTLYLCVLHLSENKQRLVPLTA